MTLGNGSMTCPDDLIIQARERLLGEPIEWLRRRALHAERLEDAVLDVLQLDDVDKIYQVLEGVLAVNGSD